MSYTYGMQQLETAMIYIWKEIIQGWYIYGDKSQYTSDNNICTLIIYSIWTGVTKELQNAAARWLPKEEPHFCNIKHRYLRHHHLNCGCYHVKHRFKHLHASARNACFLWELYSCKSCIDVCYRNWCFHILSVWDYKTWLGPHWGPHFQWLITAKLF